MIWLAFAVPDPQKAHISNFPQRLLFTVIIKCLLYKSVNGNKVQLIWHVTMRDLRKWLWPWCSDSPGYRFKIKTEQLHSSSACGMQVIHAQMFHVSYDHSWMWSGFVGEEKFCWLWFFLAGLRGEFWRVWILSFSCNVKLLLNRLRLMSDTTQACIHRHTNTKWRLLKNDLSSHSFRDWKKHMTVCELVLQYNYLVTD